MKKSFSLIVFSIFTSSILFAQTKDSLSSKPLEQKEINADNRLKRELQQKQLAAPPERLSGNVKDETSSLKKSEVAVAKGSSVHAVRQPAERRCHKKLKPGTQKK